MTNRFSPAVPLICVIISFCISCKKSNSGSNAGDDFAAQSHPSPVNTTIGVYAYSNDQASNPLQVINYGFSTSTNVVYNSIYDGFFAGPVTVDKDLSHFGFKPTILYNDPGFWQYKAFNVSSEVKNYVGFKMLNFVNTGNVRNLGGPYTLNLPGNGTLVFPYKAFDDTFGIDMNYNILVNYLDPTSNDFAVSLPSLSNADNRGYKWFLNSYGIYQIRPILTYCNCNIISQEDFFAKDISMKMPIAASQLGTAPDSIEAWHLDMHLLVWEQDGFAYKKNGFYEKNIRRWGVWNFAKPSHAVYITLLLRTTNGIPLPNTRFVVKSDGNEIAEGRTDMEGNALILVPVNDKLTFNIINDHFLNYLHIQIPDQNIGSFSRPSDVKIVLADRIDIGTLEGTVYKCDGSSFGNGAVQISQKGAKDNYIVPISNGQFTTANWISNSFGETKLSFYDAGGNLSFEVNSYVGSQYISHLKRLQENFYACPNTDSLYCNFQIDKSTPNNIRGDVSHSSPTLVAKPIPGSTEITIKDGNKGISFSMWILGGPTGVLAQGLPLSINNINCQFNPAGSSELTIYRNDGTANGFMEGWFAIDYLDPAQTPHTATGNFRLKISN